MEDLERQFNYVENVKEEIPEGDYLVIMNILKEIYHIIKGDAPIPKYKLCIECGENLRYHEDKCECCWILFEEDEMEALNMYAVLSSDDEGNVDEEIVYNRY